MKIDVIHWDVLKATGGLFSLGWNWGWGYHNAAIRKDMAGWSGKPSNYPNTNSDVVFLIDPVHMAYNKSVSMQLLERLKKENKKIVLIEYESIFQNDEPVIAGGSSTSWTSHIGNDPLWRKMMETSDLLVVADPHDKYIIHEKPTGYPPTIYLPLAVDETIFVPQKNFIKKACFIGSKWVGRRPQILNMIPNKFIDYPTTNTKGSTFADKRKATENYVQTCGKYAANLNVRTVFAGLQLRIFETMALGRMCVSHKPSFAKGRENLHKSLQNVVWYDDDFRITQTLQSLFAKPYHAINSFGERARQEVVSKHTHSIRIDQILEHI